MISPLCDRTVTVYRRLGDEATRQVLENCWFSYRQTAKLRDLTDQEDTGFLLIAPEQADILPGDRVLPGEGGEYRWEELIPARIPGLCQVAYVQPCCWGGRVSHIEAGR